jgi:hypothetical protein
MRLTFTATLLAAAALAPLSAAQAGTCASAGASPLTVGTAAIISPGAARNFALQLSKGEGVYVDLASLDATASSGEGDDHEGGDSEQPKGLTLCDASGKSLVPQPWDVFEGEGGAVSTTTDGIRLRFQAPAAGRYIVSVDAADAAREIIARSRKIEGGASGATATSLDGEVTGKIDSKAGKVWSFAGSAGQWVELKATSENDTVLALAGPDRAGDYVQLARNDDSDGLNPLIRRRLPVAGTYYLQLTSLGDASEDFTLALKKIEAPAPPPPPRPLALGAAVKDKLSGEEDIALFALSVSAGHDYRIDLTAAYDGHVAIGLPNPVEPDDGDTGPASAFSEVKAQDSGTEGTEKLTFTARQSGQLLVQVKSFGIGETDGGYTLTATDMGK